MTRARTNGRRLLRGLAILVSLVLLADSARPQDENAPPGRFELAVYAGEFGVINRLGLYEIDLELRLPAWRYCLRPIAGAALIENGGFFGYLGLRAEIPLSERFYIAPSTGLGFYEQSAYDLGGPFEIRNALELGWRPTPRTSVGVGMSHLSNGGVYDQNPGLETAYVSLGFSF